MTGVPRSEGLREAFVSVPVSADCEGLWWECRRGGSAGVKCSVINTRINHPQPGGPLGTRYANAWRAHCCPLRSAQHLSGADTVQLVYTTAVYASPVSFHIPRPLYRTSFHFPLSVYRYDNRPSGNGSRLLLRQELCKHIASFQDNDFHRRFHHQQEETVPVKSESVNHDHLICNCQHHTDKFLPGKNVTADEQSPGDRNFSTHTSRP